MHLFHVGLALASALIACATVAAGEQGPPLAPQCCEPWDNGPYDNRGAQTSQSGFDDRWNEFTRATFDDFWLCEGSIYRIRTIRGTLCTDALLPKARIVVVRDCDGRPGIREAGIIAVADSVPISTDGLPIGADCKFGSLTISETGLVNADGFRILEVQADFSKLWLKGGSYWVSIVGYSGNANPLDQFFWGYAGDGVIKGRPGVFYDSDSGEFTDVDSLCCGCTDFAFCVQGDECKIVLDSGGPDLEHHAPSLANPGSTFREARAADDVVVPRCQDRRVCYVEGYLITNCNPPRARLDVYDNACKLPATFSPPITFQPQCIEDTGINVTIDGVNLDVYRVAFWDLQAADGGPFFLQQNKNYWFSLYAVGNGAQNQRGYFAGADRCDLKCDGKTRHFNQAAVSGRGVGRLDSSWISVEQFTGTAFDLSLLVATDDRFQRLPPVTAPCAADTDRSGDVSLQDLFDFLASWFAGCP